MTAPAETVCDSSGSDSPIVQAATSQIGVTHSGGATSAMCWRSFSRATEAVSESRIPACVLAISAIGQ